MINWLAQGLLDSAGFVASCFITRDAPSPVDKHDRCVAFCECAAAQTNNDWCYLQAEGNDFLRDLSIRF